MNMKIIVFIVVAMACAMTLDAALAQQQRDSISLPKYLEIMQADRNAAFERAAYWEARAVLLTDELAKLNAELAKLKSSEPVK